MYIIKNALRNIMRQKGKNILIGCIALIIGLSACLALSIKEAASNEKENGLKGISITAQIGFDRQSMMEKIKEEGSTGESNRSEMKEQMQGIKELSLDELKKYAKADSVKSFTYSNNTTLNASGIDAVSNSSSSQDTFKNDNKFESSMGNQGDYNFTGYSSYEGMTSFSDGTNEISSGKIFDENSSALECVINKELATLNDIKVGNTITFVNPQNTKETFKIKVVGIFTSNESTTNNDGMKNMTMMDPANQVYMSYNALQSIVDNSAKNTANDTDETALHSMTNGTYIFENVEQYEKFEEEAHTLGLSDDYSVTSNDVDAYERSLLPLESLSKYATYFLLVILAIGGSILIFLNIYRIRERKYEIGVLAAIGMNKVKIASQFIMEIFVTTLLAILIGTGIGAATSVPVTNALLSTQSTQSNGFGEMGSNGPLRMNEENNTIRGSTSYIDEVSSATNLNVVLQLIGIAVLLTILSGGVAVLTILRFEPLKILSNRE